MPSLACAIPSSDYMNAFCKIMCQLDEGVLVLEGHRHERRYCFLLVDMHRSAPLEALGKAGCRDLETVTGTVTKQAHADVPLLRGNHRSLQVHTIMQHSVPA